MQLLTRDSDHTRFPQEIPWGTTGPWGTIGPKEIPGHNGPSRNSRGTMGPQEILGAQWALNKLQGHHGPSRISMGNHRKFDTIDIFFSNLCMNTIFASKKVFILLHVIQDVDPLFFLEGF